MKNLDMFDLDFQVQDHSELTPPMDQVFGTVILCSAECRKSVHIQCSKK